MKTQPKMPRQYTMSARALSARRKAAKKRRGGRTEFQVVKIPKALLADLGDLKEDSEPYWSPIARAIRALAAIHAMRGKLTTHGDADIKGLARFLEAGCLDGQGEDDGGEA